MELPDFKKLKKLADTCRKAGIKHFKSGQFEFTLSDDAPVSNYKKVKENNASSNTVSNTAFESDSLTDDELLFWSAKDPTAMFDQGENQ